MHLYSMFHHMTIPIFHEDYDIITYIKFYYIAYAVFYRDVSVKPFQYLQVVHSFIKKLHFTGVKIPHMKIKICGVINRKIEFGSEYRFNFTLQLGVIWVSFLSIALKCLVKLNRFSSTNVIIFFEIYNT